MIAPVLPITPPKRKMGMKSAPPSKMPRVKKPVSPRHLARELALQAIYHYLMNQDSVEKITASVLSTAVKSATQLLQESQERVAKGGGIEADKGIKTHAPNPDKPFFKSLVAGVLTRQSEVITALNPHVNRPWADISPTIQSILLLSVYELMFEPITPIQVILNEAIELSKGYASEDAYRFVNGVLEKCAKAVRIDDFQAMKAAR